VEGIVECVLCEAWKIVILDPIIGSNQKSNMYSKRIKDRIDKKKCFGEFTTMNLELNDLTISHMWKVIQDVCIKFLGNLELVHERPKNGKNMEDQVNAPNFVQVCNITFSCVDMCSS
jgi:hypothetical protein